MKNLSFLLMALCLVSLIACDNAPETMEEDGEVEATEESTEAVAEQEAYEETAVEAEPVPAVTEDAVAEDKPAAVQKKAVDAAITPDQDATSTKAAPVTAPVQKKTSLKKILKSKPGAKVIQGKKAVTKKVAKTAQE